ncbi:hypothetical protein MA16_Dca025394 [Dendrobium catenatum]|uniref:Uncharacterized protein n=1 Tax=Dendrobium catenatum TaxID=906689 RepID=A0A2I0WA02_9ASPA|nr:hypothetical protein MA16_Dca025394 [Dendrobium catenatum]
MPKAKLLDNKFHGNGKVCLFPSLKVLEIEKLKVLKEWFDSAAAVEGGCLFPCLTKLYLSSLSSLLVITIKYVPLLQELPNLPSSLCNLEFMDLKSLQLLPNIPASLEELNLSDLKALQCLPSSESISSLKRLHLIRIPLLNNVPQLQLLPNIPASLVELYLSDLKALQCVPSSLSISSLKKLHLIRIPLRKSLLDLPPGLKYLCCAWKI